MLLLVGRQYSSDLAWFNSSLNTLLIFWFNLHKNWFSKSVINNARNFIRMSLFYDF